MEETNIDLNSIKICLLSKADDLAEELTTHNSLAKSLDSEKAYNLEQRANIKKVHKTLKSRGVNLITVL